jgi:small multidrug resistance family-3 protein
MTFVYYFAAGLCEIAGCFSFWVWLRLGRSALWVAPGVVSLILFAALLTRVDAAFAGRAYAAYGGVYIGLGAILAVGRRGPFPRIYGISRARRFVSPAPR